MNAALAKLERQRASQERNLAAQLDAAFRRGPHTGIQMVLSGEEGQRNQRMQVYFSYFNPRPAGETIAELKKTREEMAVQKSMLEEKQSQQQTLVYEQKAQQAKLEQARNERKKTLSGLGVFHSAGSATIK